LNTFLPTNKKTILILFVVTIAVFCVAKVLLEYQWSTIGKSLQKSNFSLFLAGSVFSIIFYWLCRALRWQILLQNDGITLPLWQIYLVTGVSVGSSTVTPFQSGEALKVEYLRKHGADRLSGYTLFFVERFFDLLIVSGLGLLGIWFGFDLGISHAYFYVLAITLLTVPVGAMAIIFLFPSERLNSLRILLREKQKQKAALGAALILTAFSWLTVILGWKIALSSVSIDINFLQASSVVSLTTLMMIISFVPGAVGVSEISISTILTKMGIESSLAMKGVVLAGGLRQQITSADKNYK
jgi:uncharacterized membrane protein YbhN (UPF0104 family)